MFKNYFKTAWRNLRRNKTATLINITGLMIGMTCCLLIGLYIFHQLSYDRFHTKHPRIVRLIMGYHFNSGEEEKKGYFTSTKVLPTFQRNFPEIETGTRMTLYPGIITVEDKQFEESSILYADSTLFNVFSFKLLEGDAKNALSGFDKMVLSASTAKRYFGDKNPVGQIVKVGSDARPFEVTGVIEDCPSNSQLKYDLIASFSSLRQNQENTYWNANFMTVLLLKDAAGIESLRAKLPAFMKKETEGLNATINFYLEPFADVHLHSEYDGFTPNVSINYIYIIAAVALLILTIACFTYVNLSTARSLERAKEVGIRKVVGAEKSQIFAQFLSESVILSSIALIISFGVLLLLLPAFNKLADQELSASLLFSPFVLALSFFSIVAIGLLAGSYPAIVLSGFQPIRVLKGAFKSTSSGAMLRKTLIVFQFIISAFLIIATFIIQKQLHYIQNKKLGYERDHVLVLPFDKNVRKNFNTIKTEFKNNPDILNISGTSNTPTDINSGYNMRNASMPKEQQMAVSAVVIDEEFIKTTGIQLVAGEDISRQDMLDVSGDDDSKYFYHFILNESAVLAMGWKPQEAIGKQFWLDDSRPGIVKGVVKDFNFQSMHNPIKPLVLFPQPWARFMLVKISGKNISQTLNHMEAKWKSIIPSRPFNYHFLDEEFNTLYNNEIRLGKVINLFAGIAIALACLGLFGLSSYTTQQRIKEIGVRRVIGASVFNIVVLLSKDFVKFVLIAFVIATPIAWWAMSKWLQDYAYAIKIPVWIFGAAALLIIMITLVTISFQSIKAALMNPVKNLRSE